MPPEAPSLAELLDRRLLFVTGKGGVGKSIVSAAAALRSARQGRRTLWVEMAENPRGGYLFPGYAPAYRPQRVADRLWAMNLRFHEALEEYLEIVFRVPFVSRMIAHNALFRAFTTALPGLDALVTTGKIWYEAQRRYEGRPFWDGIVVDAPATGHGLALLKFPHAALDIVKSGPIADRARDIDALLGDREGTAILVVTLLESLPVDEATELVEGIHRDTGYQVAGVVANAALPALDGGEPERLARWLAGEADPELAELLGPAEEGARAQLRWASGWRRQQREEWARLLEVPAPCYELPWFPLLAEERLLERMTAHLEALDA